MRDFMEKKMKHARGEIFFLTEKNFLDTPMKTIIICKHKNMHVMLTERFRHCFFSDENECKYRPCDVFAHCTNTLGSFTCSCFPGYVGDGFHCQGTLRKYRKTYVFATLLGDIRFCRISI